MTGSGITEADALRATISVAEEQRENYRQDAKEARARISALEAELETLKAERTASQAELAELRAETNRLSEQLRESAMEHLARDLNDESHLEAVQRLGSELSVSQALAERARAERDEARDALEAIDDLATRWCQGKAYRSSGNEDARDGFKRGALSVAVEVRGLIRDRDPQFHDRIAARQAAARSAVTETKEGENVG